MGDRVRIIGSYLSPYVRKVLVALHVKGIAYEIDPIVPFMGDDRFSRLSPLRRIPVLIDDQVTLSDSSVICQYLEDRYPLPRLFPADPALAARARWLEEYADTRMGDVFIWRLFNETVIGPSVWGRPRDAEAVARVLREDVPDVMRYLEGELPADGFLFGEPTVADIAIAAFFRNARWARFEPDGRTWPRTAGLVRRVLALPALQHLAPFEDILLRAPPGRQREVLAAAGFPVIDSGLAGDTARRGPMSA
jgi:glutathione S-transferase